MVNPQLISLGRKCLLVLGNALMAMAWARVLFELIFLFAASYSSSLVEEEILCRNRVYPAVVGALAFSTIEFFHCFTGLTRSKPIFVLLFLVVRGGVEYFAGPYGYFIYNNEACLNWTHLYTLLCWSVGESIRFGCFTLAEIMSTSFVFPKSIRYVVGPIAFPLGAFGEMLLLKRLADHPSTTTQHRVWIWILLFLWPLGFAILMKQLLKQKKKYFDALKLQTSRTKNQ